MSRRDTRQNSESAAPTVTAKAPGSVDETVRGFIPDPSTYSQPTPGGKRRARTFSQAIADATRGVDAGMNRFTPQKPDLSSDPYNPDWRCHYNRADAPPTRRIFLNLATTQTTRVEQLRRKFRPKAMSCC
jgi:hypothetical protein